jgi:hypothetical protein
LRFKILRIKAAFLLCDEIKHLQGKKTLVVCHHPQSIAGWIADYAEANFSMQEWYTAVCPSVSFATF